MIKIFKKSAMVISSLFLMATFISPATVFAVDPPPPTPDISGAACEGSGVKIVSDPAADACTKATNGSESSFNKLVTAVLNFLSIVVGVVAVVMIIFAGFRYVSSGGNQEATKNARNTILYAVVGLVIVALSQLIVHFVLAKTSTATTPRCVTSGATHKWDSGPNKGHACTP